jgi:hypothetical protein
VLLEWPVLDVKQVEGVLRVSDEAARLGLIALERAAIIRRIEASPTGRTWAADDVFDLLERWELMLETAGI